MAFDPGAISSTLAAAVGDEPALVAELRLAFTESAERAVASMMAADTAEAWRGAAARLRGLAASFGAVRLMALAEAAEAGDPHDADSVRKLRAALRRL